MPSAEDWGWVDSQDYKPMRTFLPEASTAARELIYCGCEKDEQEDANAGTQH